MEKNQENDPPQVKVELPVISDSDKELKAMHDTRDFQSGNIQEVVPQISTQVIQVPPQADMPSDIPQVVTSPELQKTFFQRITDKLKGTPKIEDEKKVISIKDYIPNDKLAIKGGSQYVYSTIKNEELAINDYEEKQKSDLEKLQMEEVNFEGNVSKVRKEHNDFAKYMEEKKLTDGYIDSNEFKSDNLKLKQLIVKFNNINNRRFRISDDIEKIEKNLKDVDRNRRLNKEKLAKYDRAIVIGKLSEKKESGWQQEAKNFSDNATSMIGTPKIANADSLADYGGIGSEHVSRAFGNLIAPVSVGPNANSWAKTRSGDRGLVEDLVRVNQNNSITPFGVPTRQVVRNDQFTYNLPLNKIGVGDVTARGGYSINIEDIRRKKSIQKVASKPVAVRKKIKTINKKASIISIGGNLNIDMQKSTIGKTKPLKFNIDILGSQKTDIGNLKNMKLNITPININADKPQSGSVKLNMDSGIIPFTFKNIELNLNNVSSSVKKKMKVKL